MQFGRLELYVSVFFVPLHGKENAGRRGYRAHVRRGASNEDGERHEKEPVAGNVTKILVVRRGTHVGYMTFPGLG